MSRPVLLDTCASIWLMNGDGMTPESLAAIVAAQADNLGVYVSPITAWEIATLVAKNRLQLSLAPETWFATLTAMPGVRLADMPPDLLVASANLPGGPPKDPADRIIAATARAYGYVLITRDSELVPYTAAGHIEVVAC